MASEVLATLICAGCLLHWVVAGAFMFAFHRRFFEVFADHLSSAEGSARRYALVREVKPKSCACVRLVLSSQS